jgi:hypothetical protein
MTDEIIVPAKKPKWKSWTVRFFVALAAVSHGLAELQVIEPEQAWINTAIAVCGFLLRLRTAVPV